MIGKDKLAIFAEELAQAYFSEDGDQPFDKQLAMVDFDLHGFDERLCEALGIETPDQYAQRKAEEEGLVMPLAQIEPFSLGRKLVSMLGDGWTWHVAMEGLTSTAEVWCEGKEPFTATGQGHVALRKAALAALISQ